MQPPVAKPAQPTLAGAESVIHSGKGAEETSGMASLMSNPIPASEKDPMLAFWPWTSETVDANTTVAAWRMCIVTSRFRIWDS